MSNKWLLRKTREDMIINGKSKKEDKQCEKVVYRVIKQIKEELNVNLRWEKKIMLKDIIETLKLKFPNIDFGQPLDTSFMSPDGGITYIIDNFGNKYPLLIVEVKNQGTNDAREGEGLKKQAKGNAIERLGKNVIGFRTYMIDEAIFPFVCFGDGCDFEEGSSILDRVMTIAMFGKLNTDHTYNEGNSGMFNRGSYYFRKEYWTEPEMYNILYKVAKKSIYYYFSKYNDLQFIEKSKLVAKA